MSATTIARRSVSTTAPRPSRFARSPSATGCLSTPSPKFGSSTPTSTPARAAPPMLRKLIVPVLIVAVLGGVASVAYASHGDDGDGLDQVKDALDQFRSLPVADGAGYKV